MYTNNEMQISNKSYTNKDFRSIFPELLDEVKKLTHKWDPSMSNESDPGVVLLKLLALVADKNNYNIDKNILETFPLTVTQTANAHRLYDMLGYNMDWYKASSTKLTITYVGEWYDQAIIIPKYTMFTDDSGKYVFTLVNDNCVINAMSTPVSNVQVLQGTIKDYVVNGVSGITLDNLDADNRIYFYDRNVAQNGIFITNKGAYSSSWKKVDTLETCDLGERVYKFCIVPNSDTCYIQFPKDIAVLIGSGLDIKYIVTDGESGNVGANVINSFSGEFTSHGIANVGDLSTSFIIRNVSASRGGTNPETIDQAYNNYKRTIGTFETLVTNRDYENALYNLVDDNEQEFISNIVVSDRTNDLNRSTSVVEFDGISTKKNLYVDYRSVSGVSEVEMTAFDIGIYALNPMTPIYNDYYYNRSFSVIQEADLELVKDSISDSKCVSHEYVNTLSSSLQNDIYLFKNFCKLVGKVYTHYRVTQEEANEIEENIKFALFKKYNARNVNFGEPLVYESLLDTIEGADSRIKNVILNQPEYELRYMTNNDEVGDYKTSKPIQDGSSTQLLVLLAKMILGGNVQLYKFNKDVKFQWGQTDIVKYENVAKVSSEAKFSWASQVPNGGNLFGEEGYEIQDDSVNVQFIAPNLYTDKVYGSFVNYRVEIASSSDTFTISDRYYGDNHYTLIDQRGIGYIVSASRADGGHTLILAIPLNDGYDKDEFNQFEHDLYTLQSVGNNRYQASIEIRDYQVTIDLEYTFVDKKHTFNYTIKGVEINSGGNGEIPINEYHQLGDDDVIRINYVDSNNIEQNDVILGGTIVRYTDSSNQTTELSNTESTIEKSVNGGTLKFSTLTSTQQIETLKLNKITFPNSGQANKTLYCMWFTNNYEDVEQSGATIREYVLFEEGQPQRVLQEGEYFIYTNDDKNSLSILGSGTLLIRHRSSGLYPQLSFSNNLRMDDIIAQGMAAIDSDTYWKMIQLSDDYKLTLCETQIATFGKGVTIKAKNNGAPISSMGNDLVQVSEVQYKEEGQTTFTKLCEYKLSNSNVVDGVYVGWSARTKFNLMVGKDYPLELGDVGGSPSCTKQITITTKDVDGDQEDITIDSGSILSTHVIGASGGNDLSIQGSSGELISMYGYTKATISNKFSKQSDNEDILELHYQANSTTLDFSFGSDYEICSYKIPLYFTGKNENASIVVKKLIDGSIVSGDSGVTLTSEQPIQYLECVDESTSRFTGISITFNSASYFTTADSLLIYPIQVVELASEYSDQVSTTIEKVYGSSAKSNRLDDLVDLVRENAISGTTTNVVSGYSSIPYRFNPTYQVEEQDMIDTKLVPKDDYDNLFSSEAVWDVNHICNKWTIPQINTNKLDITVAPQSLKRV